MKRILLLVAAFSLLSFAKSQETKWIVYLQDRPVKSIAFENNYVWAATDSFLIQLNKLDGSKTFYQFPEIAEDVYGCLKIDREGRKWLAISRLFPNPYNRLYSFNEEGWENHSLYWNIIFITSIVTDKANCIWIMSAAFGGNILYKFEDGKMVQITPENSGIPYENVYALTTDQKGNVWFGNTSDNSIDIPDSPAMFLVKYDGENWISYPGPSGYYSKIAFDDANKIWVGMAYNPPNNVYFSDVNINSWTNYLKPIEPYSLQTIEGSENIWFGSQSDGLANYNGSEWTIYNSTNSKLPSNTINEIRIDSDGTKWIATEKGLVSLTLTTEISSKTKLDKMSFSLYPNPTHDFITLKLPIEFQGTTVKIININGQAIKSFRIENNQNKLDVSYLPAGIYLVRIQWDENQILKKFVKQ